MKFGTGQGDFLPTITFFGDSSSRDKDYMVAGGFAVPGKRILEVENHIYGIRERAGIKSEFHWADYRGGSRRKAYEELVEYGFGLIKAKHAELHMIISPFKDFDHKTKAGDTKDTSINRMYYQLCIHRLGQFYGKSRAIHVRLDVGNDSADICKMRNQACADAYKKYSTRYNCIRSIDPLPSQKSGIIQMADVILGAVAAKMNKVAHKNAKAELADFVLKASGRSSWERSTAKTARLLTVWHFLIRREGPSQP